MDSRSIHGSFVTQVERTPDAPALVAGSVRLTYRELDERADRLAHRLREHGLAPETPIAIALERSPAVVVAFLAVLKAGACYLPLHDAYPAARRQRIVDEAGSAVLLTDRVTRAAGIPHCAEVIVLDGDGVPEVDSVLDEGPTPAGPGIVVEPDHLACVMYTSGSTGQPKGVALTHRGLLSLVRDRCWDSRRHERVPMVAPHAFDVSIYELWVPLLHGGCVVLAPPGELEIDTLHRLIVEHGITGLHLTAGFFRVVMEEAPEFLAGVREVLTGGDVVSPTAVRRLVRACPGIVVRAMYGPTETTLFSTQSVVSEDDESRSTVSIGGPMDDVRVHILDERLQPVPAGATGELYLAGPRLARGYLARPDLTAERFVANPFDEPGERMYRTGDLGRRGPDGRIDFIGRLDAQVKIRGFRVEPAEVESVLTTCPGVADVAVLAQPSEPDGKLLVAYVVPGSPDLDTAAVRAHAQERLPDFMVPAAVVTVARLPLTPNGKLDRAALPLPSVQSAAQHRAPRNGTEKELCDIFAEILGVPQVGLDDNFFELGGQSLLAMRLIMRIRAVLGVTVKIDVLFAAPTAAGLADWIEAAGAPART